jgi:hypothetical protein
MTSKKRLYGTNSKQATISLFKKPQKADFDIKDKDIESAERSDRNYALARYREIVAARKVKEKLRPREPEVYHHDIFKKN